MKRRMSALMMILWTLSFALAQEKSEPRILSLEKDWNTAYRQGDVAKMNSLLSDNFIITIEDGRTFSKSGYIALNGTTVKVEVSEMSDLKVRAHGNAVAVVTGAYHEKGVSQGKPYEYHDRFTDVWMNTEGHWQLIASQYSIPAKE